jgi:Zn-dependent M28 family amino/carboxypeptidase
MIVGSSRWSLLFAPLLALPSCGGPSGPVDAGKAYAHLEKLVGFGPRPFGSDALAKTADYIEGELKKLGLSPKRHELAHEKEKKTIRNLYVPIDGPDPQNGPILIVGAHYDTKLAEGLTGKDAAHNHRFVGAIDGGGGPAVLIELARVLQQPQHKPKVNVWLYWIDAEESLDWTWNDERALLGSKAFCRMLADQKILPRCKAFVLLDLIGSRNWKFDRDGNSDLRLQEVFLQAAKAIGEEGRMYQYPTRGEIEQIQRQARQRGQPEKWGITDDHITFHNFNVPSVLLIDFHLRQPEGAQLEGYERWWHTADDDLAATDARALAFAGNLVVAALPGLETFCTRK